MRASNQEVFRRFTSRNDLNRELQDSVYEHSRRKEREEERLLPSTALQDVHVDSYKWMEDMVEIFQKRVDHMDAYEKRQFEQAKLSVEDPNVAYSLPSMTLSSDWHYGSSYIDSVHQMYAREGRGQSRIINNEFSFFDSYLRSYNDYYRRPVSSGFLYDDGYNDSISISGYINPRNEHPESALTYKGAWEHPESIFQGLMNDRNYIDYIMGRINRETYELRRKISEIKETGSVNNRVASFVLESDY